VTRFGLPCGLVELIQTNMLQVPFALLVALHTVRAASPPPPNDEFAKCLWMDGAPARVAGTCEGATYELGEPPLPHLPPPAGSVWWSWTAPSTGLAFLALVPETNSFVELSVFTGDALVELTTVPLGGSNWYADFLARAGTTYRFRVAGTGAMELRLDLRPLAPNDMFADRITLTGTDLQVTGSLVVPEEPEPGEPPFYFPGAGGYSGRSVWWSWTVPASGVVRLRSDDGVRPYLGACLGTAVDQLQVLEQGVGELSFFAETGETVAIVAGGAGCIPEFTLSLSFTPAKRTPNDNFADRIPIEGTSLSITGSTVGATREPNEPEHPWPVGPGRSVWWSWTAPANGGLRVAGKNPGVENVAVYTGSSLAELRPPPQGTWNSPWLLVRAGESYAVSVVRGQWSASLPPVEAYGPVEFDLEFIAAPPNDDFAQRLTLSGLPLAVPATNRFTTRQPGEPVHGPDWYGGSVWWTWTAPTDATVTVVAADRVAIYTGMALENLTPVASGPFGATFRATTGTAYQIAVDGGQTVFELRLVLPPPNDDFANRTTIDATPATLTGTFLGATAEPDEPAFLTSWGTRSIWWSWTAPVTGRVIIEVPWLEDRGLMGVYTGSGLTTLVPVATARFRGSLPFTVRAGTTYQIAMTIDGLSDLIVLTLSAPFAPARIDTSTLKRVSPGGLEFNVVGTEGDEFAIQASTNLLNWVLVGSARLTGAPYGFRDAESGGAPERFYRLTPWP
jgi:hypothetical protein